MRRAILGPDGRRARNAVATRFRTSAARAPMTMSTVADVPRRFRGALAAAADRRWISGIARREIRAGISERRCAEVPAHTRQLGEGASVGDERDRSHKPMTRQINPISGMPTRAIRTLPREMLPRRRGCVDARRKRWSRRDRRSKRPNAAPHPCWAGGRCAVARVAIMRRMRTAHGGPGRRHAGGRRRWPAAAAVAC